MFLTWKELIEEESKKEYYKQLKMFVDSEYAVNHVYPERKNIFKALELTPLNKVRVVILGQDPYHQPGQAQGLAFSVDEGVKLPPSLLNIFKELDREYHCGIPKSGNLEAWARQGVLLLNTVLTVRQGKPNSHAGHGWEIFTDEIIKLIGQQPQPIVFLLWGKQAQVKGQLIMQQIADGTLKGDRKILMAAHPSPLSARNFIGCDHFVKCNDFLEKHETTPIQWVSDLIFKNNDQNQYVQLSLY